MHCLLPLLVLASTLGFEHCTAEWVGQCRQGDGRAPSQLLCRYMTSEIDLEEELLISSRHRATELIIEFSDFRFFPHDGFVGTSFEKIHIRNCSILDLSDSKYAFETLEEQLKQLTVENTSFVSQWNFSHLKKLRKLQELTIRNSDLTYIPDSFKNLSRETLERLEFVNNDITWIHEEAFSQLKELKYLMLDQNDITLIKRSMFHWNTSLEVLSLGYNKIQKLPDDIFTNMKRLKVLKISGNLFSTIDETVFSPIWHQLYVFSFTDSLLSCDCRLKWLLKKKKQGPKMVFSKCSAPSSLKGKFILSLEKKELWC